MPPEFNHAIKHNDQLSDPALLSKPNPGTIAPPDSRHGFTLDSLALLVPKNVRAEVIQATSVYPLPNTPDWFSGFVNHRGEALPVFNLETLLNPATVKKSHKQWLLFLERQQKTCGLLINSCPYRLDDLTAITASRALTIPALLEPYVQGVFYDGSREWLDFSYHDFLLSLKSTF